MHLCTMYEVTGINHVNRKAVHSIIEDSNDDDNADS